MKIFSKYVFIYSHIICFYQLKFPLCYHGSVYQHEQIIIFYCSEGLCITGKFLVNPVLWRYSKLRRNYSFYNPTCYEVHFMGDLNKEGEHKRAANIQMQSLLLYFNMSENNQEAHTDGTISIVYAHFEIMVYPN